MSTPTPSATMLKMSSPPTRTWVRRRGARRRSADLGVGSGPNVIPRRVENLGDVRANPLAVVDGQRGGQHVPEFHHERRILNLRGDGQDHVVAVPRRNASTLYSTPVKRTPPAPTAGSDVRSPVRAARRRPVYIPVVGARR